MQITTPLTKVYEHLQTTESFKRLGYYNSSELFDACSVVTSGDEFLTHVMMMQDMDIKCNVIGPDEAWALIQKGIPAMGAITPGCITAAEKPFELNDKSLAVIHYYFEAEFPADKAEEYLALALPYKQAVLLEY